ncbi:MAG: hypothetical protein ACPHJD_06760 [Poseidonia sp.]
MGDTLVDLGWLAEASATPSDHDQQQNKPVALAALKFTADNIDVAKEITTEGISEDERQQYIRKISEATSSEIFEFSTCNRVLYVGFDIQADELSSTISRLNNTAAIPFELYEDTDAWRQLVKICSGLDSFMMGELQVMSQFRKSINFHKERELVGHFNSAFFEHVIAANRSVRKNLGFTHTTESMLSLATSALQTLLNERGPVKAVVLGFGDMGMKAVEALLEADQTTIAVVSRDPERSAKRNPVLAEACTMLSYEQWNDGGHEADLVISTIRNATPTYNADHQLPLSSAATVMDFSWPPSVDASGVAEQHTLLGMDHWIKVARNVGQEWDYDAIIAKSESMIDDIQERYATALENKAQGQFRALVYGTMEQLAKTWEESPHATAEDVPQLGAFSREIATWVCHQPSTFYLSELSAFVTNTKRTLSSAIIAHVDHEVKRSVLALSKQGSVSGGVP